jgi:hypothetical protein
VKQWQYQVMVRPDERPVTNVEGSMSPPSYGHSA